MRVTVLLGGLMAISILIIIFEWRAIHSISKADDNNPPSVDISEIDDGNAFAESDGLTETDAPVKVQPPSKQPPSKQFLSKSGKAVPNVVPFPAFPTPPDPRHHNCKGKTWDIATLPTITMVIPYLNEQWFQISGTVASILGHTPPELLDEILFIDDGNPPEFMFHEELRGLHPKVKVHRNAKREGLIKSKVIGAAMVRSEVIMFMEPHCIVSQQWLQPLLARMAENPDHSTLGMPTLDIIPEDNFNKYTLASLQIGGFDWSLTFNWMAAIRDRDKEYKAPDPYPTPALSGGIFAIYKDYWEKSGTYDDQMTEWGGEHIEMSLRTWRCGGRIEIVPCSRIGHVFRAANPYVVHQTAVVRNLKRAALVWLDERLEDFYTQMPHARTLDAGNVSDRLALKEKMQCKSMSWYIENIYPELNGKQPRKR